MQEPSLRTPAIFSILRLCETARDNFTPHLEELISLVGQCDAVGLTHGDTSRLLRATAEVVAHQHPENMGAAFAALVLPIDNKLKADVGAGDSPIPALERLGEVFKWTNIPTKLTDGLGEHPLFGVCGDIFETLKAVMEHFASNKSVVEEANRSVKHMLRTLDEHALPMANAILHLTVKLFHAHHHPSCLYVTTGIVKSFGGRSEELTSIIMEAVQTLAEPTFALLGSTDDALVQHPELVDDLFRLLLQTLRIIPAAVYTAEVRCSSVPAFGALLQHSRPVVLALITFLLFSVDGSWSFCLRFSRSHLFMSHNGPVVYLARRASFPTWGCHHAFKTQNSTRNCDRVPSIVYRVPSLVLRQ
jgi:hypothetical protein